MHGIGIGIGIGSAPAKFDSSGRALPDYPLHKGCPTFWHTRATFEEKKLSRTKHLILLIFVIQKKIINNVEIRTLLFFSS